jgi:HrpA-like RNA helicase
MYDGSVGLSSLKVVPISKASAIQRAGRAGRTSEGLCYRLFTFADYDRLSTVTMPEITRTELSSAILQLKALGIDNFMKLQWLTIPPSESIAQSLSSLMVHAVIDDNGRLTPLGTKVAEVPLGVKVACMVILSLWRSTKANEFSVTQLSEIQMWGRNPDDHCDDRCSGIRPPFRSSRTRENNSSRMFLLFPQAPQGPLLNSNVESSSLKKGYVVKLLYDRLMTLSFAGSSHPIEW